MKINFLAVLFISSFSFAGGGTIVRNGGGLGEMSAVMIFQKMQRYLNSCLQNVPGCGLTDQEAVLVNQISLDMPSEYQSYQLRFFSQSDGPDIMTENFVGSPISIRSAALADNNGVPYPYSQIGSLILSGLLRHHGVESIGLAKKVFLPLKSEMTSLFVNSNVDVIHWMKIESKSSSEIFDEIILEQSESSFDLFPLIQSVKLCENSESLKLRVRRMISPNPMAKTVVLDVNWNCGGIRSGQAKIELELSFTVLDTFDLNGSYARAFGVVNP